MSSTPLRSTLTLALVSLFFSSSDLRAEEQWLPIRHGHASYEVNMGQGPTHGLFRMSSEQLDRTLAKFGQQADALQRELAKLNLPAELRAKPAEAMRLLKREAKGLGEAMRFYSPPDFNPNLSTFTFIDGERHVDVLAADKESPTSSLFNVKRARQGTDRREVVERQISMQLGQGLLIDGSRGPVDQVDYREDGPRGKRRADYRALAKKGYWFAREWTDGAFSASLRSLDKQGRAEQVPLARKQASRIYHLAHGRSYRMPLSKNDPSYDAQFRTSRDVRVAALQEAGVQVVVDKRGRVYLRRGANFDRAKLRHYGLSWVGRSRNGRAAHLRTVGRR